MRQPSLIYPYYLIAWQGVLIGWLGWSEVRFAAWVEAWEDRIAREGGVLQSWFYHEDEWHYVLRLLVIDDLADRLQKQRTGRMYNDLAELLYHKLQPAITQLRAAGWWETDSFDWQAAKTRVEAVLQKYEVGLPQPSEITAYEKRIVGLVDA